MLDIQSYKHEIDALCRDLPVKRLGIFGSSLTAKFSDSSDVDVLVVVDKKFRNPYFQAAVNRTRRVVNER